MAGTVHPYGAAAIDPTALVDSHWEAVTPPLAFETPPLEEDAACDVAIIGGGYTGLWAAKQLADAHGLSVRVLEAARPGWGASGRNGGFACVGSSALSPDQLIARYSLDEARAFYRLQRDAIEHVRALLATSDRDGGLSPDGEVELAHKANRVAAFHGFAKTYQEQFGYKLTVLEKGDLAERGLDGPGFFGGLVNPHGFALNPLSYVRALAEAANEAGVLIHGDSLVTDWASDNGQHVLKTARGSLIARRVIVATNGYSRETLVPWLSGRPLPAISAVMVTRSISEDDYQAQGFFSRTMSFDSRTLLHYFRRLPDDRLLFGGRGSLDASPAGLASARQRLRADFEEMFPAWRSVETERVWSGFVCLTRDLVPYIGPIPDRPGAFAALGYHGNGVAFSSVAGRLVADLAVGAKGADNALPAVVRGPMRRFMLPAARRLFLRAAYAGFGMVDRWV
ncbi:MAG: FAD-dependent oxidoreductase [Hyphomicrobiales bacterium]|mgnify:CR=1 FL=1|nr:MAG: FAD-dependent oxidoreductase [Hyphomicrobiales bacterium]